MMDGGKYGRVVVIGIDGMEPKIVRELMDEGRLPNFRRLSESGSFMRLNTSYPPHSPVAWTSIATGSNPGKHSIFDFIIRDPKTYTPQLSLSKQTGGASYESFITADPFWRITSKANVPTTVIRWPLTFPPEEVGGDMLSGLGVPDIKGFLSGYTYVTSDESVKSEKSSNRIVYVQVNDSVIRTGIGGPRTMKSGSVADVSAPMEVRLSPEGGSAVIVVDGKEYPVEEGGWSGWIRAKFKVSMFKTVYGTFRAYLAGTEPFGLYVTAVQVDPQNPVVGISKPDGFSADLAREIGDYYTLGMPEETDGYLDERLDKGAFMAQIGQIEGEKDRMFWRGFRKFMSGQGGVFGFVYDSSDRVQHVMWNQSILEGGDLVLDDSIREYYEGKDRFLGKVLKEIDDRTLLVIISDHGFTSFERGFSMNRWLVENGYMKLSGEPPAGEDGALFQYVDWDNTRAYSLGFNSLYINVKGREGKGIVDETDRKALAAEIASKLAAYKDPGNGRGIVYRAYLREDIYGGEHVGDAPDVVVGFYPGYRMSWQTAIGGLSRDVIVENTKKWRGDHLVDPSFVPGVMFSNVKFNGDSASQMDIAPTILDAVGVNAPSSMDGRSLLAD